MSKATDTETKNDQNKYLTRTNTHKLSCLTQIMQSVQALEEIA